MKNNGVKVSYTTVYRYLYLLHEDGLLKVQKTADNEMEFCCCKQLFQANNLQGTQDAKA